MEKMKCPHCGGKGAAVRGEKPRFVLKHSQRGSQVDEYRHTMMNCRSCARDYVARELRDAMGWLFDKYSGVEAFYGLPEEKPGVMFVGSTASEYSKRISRGVDVL